MASSQQYERRKKRRSEASSSQQQPPIHLPSIHVSHFTAEKSHALFKELMDSRSIYIERIISEEFLISVNFTWLQLLRDQGWLDFMRIEEPVRPNLVKLFYFFADTTRRNEQGVEIRGIGLSDEFTTKVLGHEFNIEEALIREFVKDGRNAGAAFSIPSRDKKQAVLDSRIVFRNPSLEYVENKCAKMDGCTRILHYIVSQVLYPRAGSYSDATYKDLFIMARIIEGNPPNISALVVSRMLELINAMAKRKRDNDKPKDYNLPYGKLVTRICMEYCDVPDDEPINNANAMEELKIGSLTQYGWMQDPVTKRLLRDPSHDEPSNLQLMQKMTEMMGTMNVNFHEFHSGINNMQERQARIEARQERLEAQNEVLDAQNVLLHEQLMTINPSFSMPHPFPSFDHSNPES